MRGMVAPRELAEGPQPDLWAAATRAPEPTKTPKPHYLGHRDRLRDRAAATLDALPDYELLELHLFRAIPRGDVKPLAKALIARFGSLAAVLAASPAELKTVAGVGEAVARDLKLLHQTALRVGREAVGRRTVITSWSQLLAYVKLALAHEPREQFRVLFLDKKNQLIADEVMNHGTVDHAPVYPREVMRRALELSSSAVILVHNHPSGDPTPSGADIQMTREVVEAGRPLRIAVHDHLVVGRDGVASFRALGLF
ncbi:DNA repair protein RadC [Phenylobacterium sp.]|uniref:RadC family protein n=1 Tax=Phenylobacterium sp. TaxID=1871053 RepID=UPI002734CBEF|nr:DNA repair protein RadC [Phenylobacterium sp.]MDP3853510.1 DNA repair protein RadC [Phenylobacterium sp.]